MTFLYPGGVIGGDDQRDVADRLDAAAVLPSRPMCVQPAWRATSSAFWTFGELPLVEMPITASPGTASASTWREKIRSKP